MVSILTNPIPGIDLAPFVKVYISISLYLYLYLYLSIYLAAKSFQKTIVFILRVRLKFT